MGGRGAGDDLVDDPGPVVIGAVQGASALLAAYELVLNLAYQLHKRCIEVPISFVTPEPYLGHLGMGLGREHNVVAHIRGRRMIDLAPGELHTREVIDAGDEGLILVAEHFFERRETTWFIPGPEAHWAKVAWEKLFMATRRRGLV